MDNHRPELLSYQGRLEESGTWLRTEVLELFNISLYRSHKPTIPITLVPLEGLGVLQHRHNPSIIPTHPMVLLQLHRFQQVLHNRTVALRRT